MLEGFGRSDGAFFRAMEGDGFGLAGCGGNAISRGDGTGVGLRLFAGVSLGEAAGGGTCASGCNEVVLDGSAGGGLRLNFEVGGPTEYFLVEEYDDLVDRAWTLGVSSFTAGGGGTGASSFTAGGGCPGASSFTVAGAWTDGPSSVVVEVPALLSLRLMSAVVSESVEANVASPDKSAI